MNDLPEFPVNAALFLDFDGTLVDFAPSPDTITVPDNLLRLLKQLESNLCGALALVTGRSVANLSKHLNNHPFAIAGEHGRHITFSDGRKIMSSAAVFRRQLIAADDAFGDIEQLEIERKAGGFAVHYRRAPEWKSSITAFMREMVVDRPDLELLEGNMLVELRSKGIHKGNAIEMYMTKSPFSDRIPVFLGDDVTDEDGFRSVNKLDGLAIKIGQGDTLAPYRLSNVEAVYEWLSEASGLERGKEQSWDV